MSQNILKIVSCIIKNDKINIWWKFKVLMVNSLFLTTKWYVTMFPTST